MWTIATWFLIIIYLAFISLGLPDSLLGSAWPAMWPGMGASVGSAGILSMVVAAGTIVSSLASGSIVQRLGTGKVTLISCILTAGALLGFSMAPSMIWLVIFAIPLGLGGGSVDAALNHYVAQNYEAHHMNWLHCFWGVGATLGPIIMSFYIANHHSWRSGYAAVSAIQFLLVIILFITLPLWKRISASREIARSTSSLQPPGQDDSVLIQPEENPSTNILRIQGVKQTLVSFLFYCGVESTAGLWGASYLVGAREISAETAALWISLYYGGITIGRFITGFITLHIHNRVLIRCGQIVAIAGGLMLLFPNPSLILTGLILIGLGLAPIFPGLLHETPSRFGRKHAAKLMGYQMAVAYTGTTCLPPLFGLIAEQTSIALFPYVVLAFTVFMMMSVEIVNHILNNQVKSNGL